MNESVEVQHVTTALIALLQSPVNEGGTGRPVGDHGVPKNVAFPYYVVYQIPGGSYWGAPLVDPHGGAEVHYIVRSVGNRRDQAQLAADVARRVIVGRDHTGAFVSILPPPAGYVICDRLTPQDAPPGVDREGTPPNQVFSVPEQFAIVISPE